MQQLLREDYVAHQELAGLMLQNIYEEGGYMNYFVFSDEATVHVSGYMNKHNYCVWGYENPHTVTELETASAKVIAWCAIAHHMVIRPFFFM